MKLRPRRALRAAPLPESGSSPSTVTTRSITPSPRLITAVALASASGLTTAGAGDGLTGTEGAGAGTGEAGTGEAGTGVDMPIEYLRLKNAPLLLAKHKDVNRLREISVHAERRLPERARRSPRR
jgi:hypothetical protein